LFGSFGLFAGEDPVHAREGSPQTSAASKQQPDRLALYLKGLKIGGLLDRICAQAFARLDCDSSSSAALQSLRAPNQDPSELMNTSQQTRSWLRTGVTVPASPNQVTAIKSIRTCCFLFLLCTLILQKEIEASRSRSPAIATAQTIVSVIVFGLTVSPRRKQSEQRNY
jgi:hypothetical protein